MIPLVKLLFLFVRMFTKPATAYIKQVTKYRGVGYFRNHLIWAGNKLHRIEAIINKRFMKVETNSNLVRNLGDEAAIEYALTFFFEGIFLYGILVTVAITEMKKASESSKKLNDDIDYLKGSVESMKAKIMKDDETIDLLRKENEKYQSIQEIMNNKLDIIVRELTNKEIVDLNVAEYVKTLSYGPLIHKDQLQVRDYNNDDNENKENNSEAKPNHSS